ncbi:MAG: chorismate synthase [Flavobacteriales bacterium]|nr:chorismate synthase [Flavobacteriales bacterium]
MNTMGYLLRLTTFGESHGPVVGGVLDGFPAGFRPDLAQVRLWNARRRPGSTPLGTERQESDEPEFLSGLSQGLTTGAPIAFVIRNRDQRSQDYDTLNQVFRPSHADYTYWAKYGQPPAPGGGRASARETAVRVTAGALALQWLQARGVTLAAWTENIGGVHYPCPPEPPPEDMIYASPTRCPDPDISARMASLVEQVRERGDSIGGTVRCMVTGLPPGLGEPLYGKITALIGQALFSLNAVRGVDFGVGFDGLSRTGSELNDAFIREGDTIRTLTNHSGGVQGGITNGMPLVFRVLFKPAATIAQSQQTVNLKGEPTHVEGRGRHDPCVVPRAVPVVVALTALVLMDAWLLHSARYKVDEKFREHFENKKL